MTFSPLRRVRLIVVLLGTAVLVVRCAIGGEGSAAVELWLDRVLYNGTLLLAAVLMLARAVRGSDRLAWQARAAATASGGEHDRVAAGLRLAQSWFGLSAISWRSK